MLLKLDYLDYKPNASIKLRIEDKEQVPKQILRVNQETIEPALSIADSANIVALHFMSSEYYADMQFLRTFFENKQPPKKPLLYKMDLHAADPQALQMQTFVDYCSAIAPFVRVIFQLPSEFVNMGIVITLSQTYPSVRFCGGKLLRHPGASIGCLSCEELGVSKGRLRSAVSNGCACPMETIDFADADVIFTEKTQRTTKSKVDSGEHSTKAKSKGSGGKQASSLFSLTQDGLGAF